MNSIDALYATKLGSAYLGDSLNLLDDLEGESIDLVITSPPFALQHEKAYGNVDQTVYVDWLFEFCKKVYRVLAPSGSFVIDLGGAYQKKKPIRSLHSYRILIKLCDELNFKLAEEFFWFNPSKLPSPAEWVTIRKIRTKDSVNTIWWLCKDDFPKADATQVRVPYSARMKKLHKDPDKYYKPTTRPSGHDIGLGFGVDNGGALPSNLLEIPNTESASNYIRLCKALNVDCHPARFPSQLPTFFIKFLTEPGDIVLDIFAGSNTTGSVAEKLNRRWIAFENNHQYLSASILRFLHDFELDEIKSIYRNFTTSQGTLHIDVLKSSTQHLLFDDI